MSKTRSSALKRGREQKKAEKIAMKRRRKEERRAQQPVAETVETTDPVLKPAPPTDSEPLDPPIVAEPPSGSTQIPQD